MTSVRTLLRDLALTILLLSAITSPAAAITVTNLTDDVAAPPTGSLRKAIADAADGDTIEFDAGLSGTITLGGAELLLDKNLTINGPGANVLAISGNQQSRVFRVPADAVLTINGLTIRNGQAPYGDGGAIANTSGVLTMSKCLITGSKAGPGEFGGNGGGLSSINGTLNLVDCTISANIGGPGRAGGDGGGVYCEGGSARLERCTIQQNRPGFGVGYIGGIYSAPGGRGGGLQITSNCTVDINTCTITGNICGESEVDGVNRSSRISSPGAGIYCVSGTVSIVSTTIYGNVGNVGHYGLSSEPVFPTGTGLFVQGGAVTLSNTIIAGNNSGYGHQDLAGTVTSAGHNLIGFFDNTRAAGIVPGTNGDQAGTQAFSPLDPLLGPLTDFGAPTSVLPLLAGSPAFESGNDQLTGTDQRGQPRPTGAHVDIGAFEGLATVIQFGSATGLIPEHGGSVTITVVRESNLTDSVSVSYATADESATAGNDYSPQSGTLTFGPGVTQQSITIPITDDSIIDPGEKFTIQLTSPTGHSVLGSKQTQSITIVDNDNTVQFASAPSSILEQGGSAAITVFREGSLTDSVSVSYATADESATAGKDYVSQSGTLTFGPGVTQQTISILIIDDSIVESDETFTVQLSSPASHTSLGSTSLHRITVVSDSPEPDPTVFTVTNTEDNPTAPPPGSLRHAIATAASGDTIQFSATVTGTITLGGAELLIGKNLTITGPGAAVLAVSGNQLSRVFRVPAGKVVAISGLAIRDGKAADGPDFYAINDDTPTKPGEPGGGILNEGSLTLTTCWLANNAAGGGGDRSGNDKKSAGSGGSGGAISSSGALTLVDCKVSGNSAGRGGELYSAGPNPSSVSAGTGGSGGAIFVSSGDLQLFNCNFDQNSAGEGGTANPLRYSGNGGSGGSIAISGVSSQPLTALIEGCSILRSRAGKGGGVDPTTNYPGWGGWGGGISFLYTNATLKSCTISGNQAGGVQPNNYPAAEGGSGGGVGCNYSTVNLISCTISDNVAGENPGVPSAIQTFTFRDGSGGGIRNASGAVTLRNTIVAGNRNTNPSGSEVLGYTRDVSGTFVSEGHNLIGSKDGSNGFASGVNGDIVGSTASPVDPLLAVLGDYGGNTLTHVLVSGSPAVEAGDDSIVGTDQRGQPRLTGAHVDIGAVEGAVQNGVSFAAADSEVVESASVCTIIVQRVGDLSTAASVQYSSGGGTATVGTNYTSVSGTIDFAPAQTQATIDVPIMDNATAGSPKTFELRLSSPSANSAIYRHETCVVTIYDDEGPGILQFATSRTTPSENAGNALITVVRKTVRSEQSRYPMRQQTAPLAQMAITGLRVVR
jgi:hypothetical protein